MHNHAMITANDEVSAATKLDELAKLGWELVCGYGVLKPSETVIGKPPETIHYFVIRRNVDA